MAARLGCNESELCQSESAQACRNQPIGGSDDPQGKKAHDRSFLAAFLEAHLREGVSLKQQFYYCLFSDKHLLMSMPAPRFILGAGFFSMQTRQLSLNTADFGGL